MKPWVIVPAAGTGQRFLAAPDSGGCALPKQYCRLLDKPLIVHTLEILLSLNPARVVVAVHPEDQHWRALPICKHPQLLFVEGGTRREDSVLNGLLAIADQAQPDDPVLVHDVARPCVVLQDIKKLLELAGDQAEGGLLASPLTDTIKRTDLSHKVSGTVERDTLWAALTPQVCHYALLVSVLNSAKNKGLTITDEASALEAAGYQPKLVKGRRDNIKVTFPEDLLMAEAILLAQEKMSQQTG